MSRGKAGPGKEFIVKKDGDIEEVVGQTTGDIGSAANWNDLLRANAKPATKRKVKQGERWIIPGEPPPLKLTDRQPDDLTITIDGMVVPVMSAKIIRTMDTASDAWSATITWTPGANPKLDHATRPYGYTRAAAYIGNELLVNGRLYEVAPEMTNSGITKGLVGYSFTIDAVDSHVLPPHEWNGCTLKQICSVLLPPLGIEAVFETDQGAAFEVAASEDGDTIFGFLAKLASQRGILISSNPTGDMTFLRAKTTGTPVGTLEEGQALPIGWSAKYDGRKRFGFYRLLTAGVKQGPVQASSWRDLLGTGNTTKVNAPTVIERDIHVPVSRVMSFRADDCNKGQVKGAARWKKNRQFVEALEQSFPVSSWYAPNGTLWRENTLVVVKSAVMGVPDGFTFLIRSVEYELENNKQSAILHLIPPQAFTDKDIGEIWK